MALSSALFSGISGLSSLGNAMQIIGDNIANVNTVGFKGSSFTFQDLLSQSISTQSGTSQVGRGTAIGDVAASFEQGSFESTGSTTDLAIGGDGFFALREAGSDNLFYSRAGNFQFNNDGYLTNPEGYVVQGWKLDENGQDSGSVTDILLDSFTSPPEQSSKVNIVSNLNTDAQGNDYSTNDIATHWDGTTGGMDDNYYSYQSTVKVFDSLGSTHDITIYFDRDNSQQSTWQYVVACNPEEDMRTGASGTAGAGLLAKGTISFSDSSGTIDPSAASFTMQTSDGAGAWTDLSGSPPTVDSAGLYEFHPDFLGGTGTQMDIALDLGTHYNSGAWTNNALTTTQYARSSTTVFQSADGYGAGDLQSVDVDVDGTMTGVYSNGQLLPLFRAFTRRETVSTGKPGKVETL
jgi:flagellar hook-basal body protein